MTDDEQTRFDAAMDLVDAAFELDEEGRTALLAAAPPDVRREAERLLAADAKQGLSESAPGAREALRAFVDLEAGNLIGPFRLVSFLGRGGMGEVWLAERTNVDFDQKIALKLLPAGEASSVARFRQERRILARLTHPSIARLLDGGVTREGRPWLGMELIEGKNLIEHARTLEIDARLRLFAEICDAVQFAHQNLVIHRDLKPSNILVDADGKAKLLDFGIAKLLEPDSASDQPLTRTNERPMTLEYAAPEQVRGEAVTTASDIWSLGVILCELLSGRRPYHATAKNRIDVEHAILAAEPLRPSLQISDPALRRKLRGDLDAIVLKATRKDPKERYATADAFATDVRRHSARLPVTARRESTGYVIRSAILRHRAAFAVSGVVFASLVVGLVGTLWQAKRAREEARRATLTQAFVVDMLRAFDPDETGGKQVTQQDILSRGESRLRELDDQPEVQAHLLHVFADTWYAIGEYDHAKRTAERALALEEHTLGPRSIEVAKSLIVIGDSEFELGDYTASGLSIERALAIARDVEGASGLTVATALNELAGVKRKLTDYPTAERLRREALEITRTRLGEKDPRTLAIMNDLAVLLGDEQNYVESTSLQERTCATMAEVRGAESPDTLVCRANVGRNYLEMGRANDAETLLRNVRDAQTRILGEDWVSTASTELLLGRALDAEGRYAEAVSTFDAAITRGKKLGDHPTTATALVWESQSLISLGKKGDAESTARRALAMCVATVGAEHACSGRAHYAIGRALSSEGHHAEARAELEAALAIQTKKLGNTHSDTNRTRAAIEKEK